MTEDSRKEKILTKRNILLFLRNFGLTFLILSPIFIFLGLMYLYQLTYPDVKDPFVQWSGHDPRTEAIITWETKEKEESTVWYGTNKDNLKWDENDDEDVYIHKIILEGLDPDTKYYYQVNIDNSEKSEVFSFITAPDDTDTEFDFIAYSDSQFFGIGWHNQICDAIARHDDISFVTDVGDLTQDWDEKPDWNQFFKETSVYMRKYPFVPIMGNHDGYYPEDDPDAKLHWYETYFGATNTSCDPHTFYYSFNWSNTLFIVAEISKSGDEDISLDRNIRHDIWLNKTLANGQDKTFRVLMFHRQLFSAEDDNDGLIARIVPIVEKYNISLVLYGHHHHYERFLYNDHTYVCLGGGGGQQFGANYFNPGENTECFAMGPSYTKISVESNKITLTTFSPENDVIDNCILKLKDSKAILQE